MFINFYIIHKLEQAHVLMGIFQATRDKMFPISSCLFGFFKNYSLHLIMHIRGEGEMIHMSRYLWRSQRH